jgi:hypothetical protein
LLVLLRFILREEFSFDLRLLRSITEGIFGGFGSRGWVLDLKCFGLVVDKNRVSLNCTVVYTSGGEH